MHHFQTLACSCGVKYKIVTDEESAKVFVSFTCPSCEERHRLSEKVVSVHAEVQPNIWRMIA